MESSYSQSTTANGFIPFDNDDVDIPSDSTLLASKQKYQCAMKSHARKARYCCLPCAVLMCDLCVISGMHATHGTPILVENAVAEMLHQAVPLVERLQARQPLFDQFNAHAATQQQKFTATRKQVNDYFDAIAAAVEAQRSSALSHIAKAEKEVATTTSNLSLIVPLLKPEGLAALTPSNNSLIDALQLFRELHIVIDQVDSGHFVHVPFIDFAPGQSKEQMRSQSIVHFGKMGSLEGEFQFVNDMCWTSDHSIAVAEFSNKRIQEVSITGVPLNIIACQSRCQSVAYQPSTAQLYVCEQGGKEVKVYNKSRKLATSIPCLEEQDRVEIPQDSHEVYLLTNLNKLVRLSPPLSIQLPSRPPTGITCNFAINKTHQQVIFCDYNRHEVQVYSLKSTSHLFQLGATGPGSQVHQFFHPRAAEIDPNTSNIIIADCINKRLSVWKDDGTFLQVVPVPDHPLALRINPQGTHLAIGFPCSIMVVPLPLLSSYV